MKKILCLTLCVLLAMGPLATLPVFAKSVIMYADDGRTLWINDWEIEAYRKVGWYYGKPVTMYALDGRTLTVGENDIEAYRKVGWYYGKPVTMYAPDGRTLTVGENDVEMYRNVGWYLPSDLYGESSLLNTLYQFDYLEVYRNFIKSKGKNWKCPPPTNHLLPIQFDIGKSNATFQDAYAIDVDNDGVLELVALFSNEHYGALAVYECENGQVTESYRRVGRRPYGYRHYHNPYCNYELVKNGLEYAFIEEEIYNDWIAGTSYFGYRLNKGFEGILISQKSYEHHPEWNEYMVYNQPKDSTEFDAQFDTIRTYKENSTPLFSAGDYHSEIPLEGRDLAKGTNLEKYCMPDITEELTYYAKNAKADSISDLTLGAFKLYEMGYYYEALSLCDRILEIRGITSEQFADVTNIINYCNDKLYASTVASIQRIQAMMDKGQYYEALTEITACKKGNCSQEQLNQLAAMESVCKDGISAHETKMNQYTTIYAKSGMEMTVQNKEVQGYLDSGLWFLTPTKTWSQMKQAAYQYAKNAVSSDLYYPKSAIYPSLNEVDFWLESQDGSQAEYVVAFGMPVMGGYGNYIYSYFTCTLYCNPYGFYDYYIEED